MRRRPCRNTEVGRVPREPILSSTADWSSGSASKRFHTCRCRCRRRWSTAGPSNHWHQQHFPPWTVSPHPWHSSDCPADSKSSSSVGKCWLPSSSSSWSCAESMADAKSDAVGGHFGVLANVSESTHLSFSFPYSIAYELRKNRTALKHLRESHFGQCSCGTELEAGRQDDPFHAAARGRLTWPTAWTPLEIALCYTFTTGRNSQHYNTRVGRADGMPSSVAGQTERSLQ